jgi:hypothetical protein
MARIRFIKGVQTPGFRFVSQRHLHEPSANSVKADGAEVNPSMHHRRADWPGSDALVLFGVTGDLAHERIFPALYAMARKGVLSIS